MTLLKETKCSIAAAFFTHKGRILAPTLLHFHGRESEDVSSSDEEESILIDTASCFHSELEQHLKRYKLRSKVSIRTVATNRYFAPATAIVPAALAQTAPPPHEVYCSSPDPRSTLLGSHVLTLAGESTAGGMRDDDVALRSEQWLERLLTLHGIADGAALASRIPLECNLDLLQYISFSKGCYVGQELTARTKYKVRSDLLHPTHSG